jgi:hypothetical protein
MQTLPVEQSLDFAHFWIPRSGSCGPSALDEVEEGPLFAHPIKSPSIVTIIPVERVEIRVMEASSTPRFASGVPAKNHSRGAAAIAPRARERGGQAPRRRSLLQHPRRATRRRDGRRGLVPALQ